MLLIAPLEQFRVTIGSFSRVEQFHLTAAGCPSKTRKSARNPFFLHNTHQIGVKFVL